MSKSIRLITIVAAISALCVVAMALVAGHYWTNANPGNPPTPKESEQFLNHLQFLWERYLEMVQLLITLLTAVIAASAGMVKFGRRDSVANRGYFAAGSVSLLVGLACAALWRIDAQLLMEMEIFGDANTVAALFKKHGVLPSFTSSYEYLNGLSSFSIAAKIFMIGTAAGLLAGLALMSLFAYSNLPEATRRKDHDPQAKPAHSERGAGK
jgi:hypothetical protein